MTESPQYELSDIVKCMKISARMLQLADGGNDKNYLGQARLLLAAADDLELRQAAANTAPQ